MKIVHVDLGKTLRGGQEQLLLLAPGLQKRGHDQWLVCREGAPIAASARARGLEVFTSPRFDPGQLRAIGRLCRLLRKVRPEVLHAHDARGQNLAWLASLGRPIRRAANRDVTFHPRIPGGHWLQRWKYTHTADLVLTCSDYVKQSLVGAGVPPSRIEVVYSAVEPPKQPYGIRQSSVARAAWGLGEQDFVAGHIGAFSHEKGQDIALKAAAILKPQLPHLKIILAGQTSGEALHALRERHPGLENQVLLPGYVADLEAFFSGLDVFIMPSRGEGLGISALQAMARGLAVIATRVGGLPEIVEDGRTGWLIPPDSPLALAEAIVQAYCNRSKLAEFGRNGRERAAEFSVESMVSRTEALYEYLASRS